METIRTAKAMAMDALRRWREKVWMAIAWRLPKTLVMWCAVRLMAYATQGKYSSQIVPELTAMDALGRWPAC